MNRSAARVLAPVDEVLAGLRAPRKHLPCRLLYDRRGAELFERICTLPDYYPTRSELALLATHLPAIARTLGPRVRVVEPGSGAGQKTRMLLAALHEPVGYVPIDISGDQLDANARALRDEFSGLDVQPVHADYTAPLVIPRSPIAAARTLVFFPGSTLGNFEPDEALAFLSRLRALAGDGGALVLGTDSNRDPESLLRAYDDRDGVTAAFDLNVLAHVNRTHDASFVLDDFVHRARWRAARSRVEMHLVSRRSHDVRVAGETIRLTGGESIVTEHCYKHRPEVVSAMLVAAGWRVADVMIDRHDRIWLWLAVTASQG